MKWKTKQYHIFEKVIKSSRKIIERGKIETSSKQIHGRSNLFPGTRSGGVLASFMGTNNYWIR